eukprot:scaffold7897_cov130-Skeletonema_marinoi.AAC.5
MSTAIQYQNPCCGTFEGIPLLFRIPGQLIGWVSENVSNLPPPYRCCICLSLLPRFKEIQSKITFVSDPISLINSQTVESSITAVKAATLATISGRMRAWRLVLMGYIFLSFTGRSWSISVEMIERSFSLCCGAITGARTIRTRREDTYLGGTAACMDKTAFVDDCVDAIMILLLYY